MTLELSIVFKIDSKLDALMLCITEQKFCDTSSDSQGKKKNPLFLVS